MKSAGWLLEQLPQRMVEDRLVTVIVTELEQIANGIRDEVENIPFFFDYQSTNADFLAWMASWLSVSMDQPMQLRRLPEERLRNFVRTAGELFLYKGTRVGLQGTLAALTGARIQVTETGGVRSLGETQLRPKHVLVDIDQLGGLSAAAIYRLIEREMSVDTAFEFRVRGELYDPFADANGALPE